jgi:ubiquinone/menaquinone biosynthesis C-methylase UbiE
MADTNSFWDAFSPYMDYLENAIGINSDNLEPIIPLIQSPVLVVGAGQGLLVGELRKLGFSTEGIDLSPEMVASAEKRRGIKLFLGNANNMPFLDHQFKTSIVATGVLDFTDDRSQIGAIIREVRRVTEAQGEIFVAFLGATPQLEALLRYIGFLSVDNRTNPKMIVQIALGPKGYLREIIAHIMKDPNKSIPGFIVRAIRSFLSMRKRATARIKGWRELKKKAQYGEIPDPRILIDYLPESAFIRRGEQIHELFKSMNLSPKNIFIFDNCKIAQF